jgi:hypothetical protein
MSIFSSQGTFKAVLPLQIALWGLNQVLRVENGEKNLQTHRFTLHCLASLEVPSNMQTERVSATEAASKKSTETMERLQNLG